MATLSLQERLAAGPVLCAEGYLFELERRGWVQIGPFVPSVVLDHPEAVLELHREYLRAGSDVVEAFTYYANRHKLKLVGREAHVDTLNRQALRLAHQVAAEGHALVAGNISNSTIFRRDDPDALAQTRLMFDETAQMAADAGAHFIIAETFDEVDEAQLALDAIHRVGLPAVVTFSVHRDGVLRNGVSAVEGCLRMRSAGAAVVGLNCAQGPATMLPILRGLARAVPGPVAGLPVPYRTTAERPTMQTLCSHDRMYMELEPHLCTRFEMAEFARLAVEAGVQYVGVCCGGAPYHVRAMAEALGRRPPASEFSADLSKHFAFGDDPQLAKHYTDADYREWMSAKRQ